MTTKKMLPRIFLWIFCALILSPAMVTAYSKGAPIATCDTLTPRHRDAVPQTSNSPYKITLAKNSVKAEGQLNGL